MPKLAVSGIQDFLHDYPGMAIRPSQEISKLTLIGEFDFSAYSGEHEEITDSYRLQIVVHSSFPRSIPEVKVVENKIPDDGKYHVNSDGTLCLGSRLRLLFKISSKPTLSGFAELCLVPYLYAVSYKRKFGGEFLFCELLHGISGELLDYVDLFGLKEPDQARSVLCLIAMKKRLANKHSCPCGCGRLLGNCLFNNRIKRFRDLADRGWYKSLISGMV